MNLKNIINSGEEYDITQKYSRSRKYRIKGKILGTVLIIGCFITTAYLYFDYSSVDTSNYIVLENDNMLSTSYKQSFKKLVSDITKNIQTGITSYDDRNVSYGTSIPTIMGTGDFKHIDSSIGTSVKSYSFINNAGFSYGNKKGAGKPLEQFIYNPFFLQQCTVSEPHGIVKFLDRYVLAACGTYFSYAQGNPAGEDRGKFYKVETDKGIIYDILIVDTKGDGALDKVVKTEPGYNSGNFVTVGHLYGKDFCLTEIYRLCTWPKTQHGKPNYYPIRKAWPYPSGTDNGIDYPNTMMEYKDDNMGYSWSHPTVPGNDAISTTDLPAFEGNVISFTPIIDEEASKILNDSIETYYSGGFNGKEVVYDKDGVICSHTY